MRFLLDTNICIYAMRTRPESVQRRLAAARSADLAISTVTVFELWYGVFCSKAVARNSDALREFLAPLRQLEFDVEDAATCAKIRASLEAGGTPIGPYDLQIAAQALRRKLTLVTHDTAEFKRIAGLKLADWA
ncbi:MAG TPA: type II toxin-antitoxin system VapC family toxin [Pseudomonadota bacterium]|nr:type II toxin-antitoxin system VapC family toxin [Pseudomonadota bacterium]